MDARSQLCLLAGLLLLGIALACGVLLVVSEEPFARLGFPRWGKLSLFLFMIGCMLLAQSLLSC